MRRFKRSPPIAQHGSGITLALRVLTDFVSACIAKNPLSTNLSNPLKDVE